jgi:hypothetical protein
MRDLTPLLNLLLFGGSTPQANGGIRKATGLNEAHVVEFTSPADRPTTPYVTWIVTDAGGRPLYGPPCNPYVSVVSVEAYEETLNYLHYSNAHEVVLRLEAFGVKPAQTEEGVRAIQEDIGRYLSHQARTELSLAGIKAHVQDVGTVRNATTVLNDEVDIRYARDVTLVVDDEFDVPVETFEKVTISVGAPDGAEEKEVILP